MATIYHVATDGSGDKTTIAAANAVAVSGDSILMKSGDSFAESVSLKSGITYGKYGSGDKPIIQNFSQKVTTGNTLSNIIIESLSINSNSLVTHGILIDCQENAFASGITIRNNDIYDNRYGIFLRDFTSIEDETYSYFDIYGNNIYSNSEYGIACMRLSHSNVSSNNVYANGDNTILSTNGIWIGTGVDVIIEKNVVYNNATGNYDGMGIYLDWAITDGVGSSYCTIRNNLVYGHDSQHLLFSYPDILTNSNSSGIAITSNSHNNKVYNNIVYGNCFGIGLWTAFTSDNLIYNNTLSHNRVGIFANVRLETGNSLKNNIVSDNDLQTEDYSSNWGIMIGYFDGSVTGDYNDVYNNGINFLNYTDGIHSITSDPLLRSDYGLQSGSPAINAGTTLPEVTDDYEGVSRISGYYDIGAYAYTIIDPDGTVETKELRQTLLSAQGNYIYWGEYGFVRSNVAYSESQPYLITGKFPYVFGLDFDSSLGTTDSVNDGDNEVKMKNHYRGGGILTLQWHMYNWVTGGDSRDTTGDPVVNILPSGTHRATYLSQLDSFAAWCLDFKDDNGDLIPIIFRPFHEADQVGFWWGPSTCTEAQFIQLWQDMVTYLRDTKGVHNLIYVYAPQLSSAYPTYISTLYPGDEYVDVFGIDRYTNNDDLSTWDGKNVLTCYQDAYDASVLHNKIFAIVEGMRNLQAAPKDDYWTWYSNLILNDSKAKNAAYVLNWLTPKSISTTRWGALDESIDEASYLSMSKNSKIKFIGYPTQGLNFNGFILDGVVVT